MTGTKTSEDHTALIWVLVPLQDFVHARLLFSACLELVTEFSPKLRQVMLNEMLLLEVRAHETVAAEGSRERPPPDLVSRVRGYLEMRIHGGLQTEKRTLSVLFKHHYTYTARDSILTQNVSNGLYLSHFGPITPN